MKPPPAGRWMRAPRTVSARTRLGAGIVLASVALLAVALLVLEARSDSPPASDGNLAPVVAYVPRTYSADELASAQARVSADAPRWEAAGVQIATVGINQATNRVHISVAQMTTAQGIALQLAYAHMIELEWVADLPCAGIGFAGLVASIDDAGVVTGRGVNPADLDNPSPMSHLLTWPRGFELRRGADGWEVVSPDSAMVIRDGTVLADGGACVGEGLYVVDPGHIVRP